MSYLSPAADSVRLLPGQVEHPGSYPSKGIPLIHGSIASILSFSRKQQVGIIVDDLSEDDLMAVERNSTIIEDYKWDGWVESILNKKTVAGEPLLLCDSHTRR